jgi:hypothetical protein
MAGINKSWICLYSTKGISAAWVDGSAVRGEGDVSCVRFVVPTSLSGDTGPELARTRRARRKLLGR